MQQKSARIGSEEFDQNVNI